MAEVKDWTTDYDIFDPSYKKNPYPLWDEIRGKCPVAHTDRWGGSFMPTRYEDLFNIARDITHFSSRNVLVTDFEEPPEGAEYVEPTEADLAQYNVGAPPITSDPPVHTWARKLLLPPFSATSVSKWEAETRELCASLVDGFLEILDGRLFLLLGFLRLGLGHGLGGLGHGLGGLLGGLGARGRLVLGFLHLLGHLVGVLLDLLLLRLQVLDLALGKLLVKAPLLLCQRVPGGLQLLHSLTLVGPGLLGVGRGGRLPGLPLLAEVLSGLVHLLRGTLGLPAGSFDRLVHPRGLGFLAVAQLALQLLSQLPRLPGELGLGRAGLGITLRSHRLLGTDHGLEGSQGLGHLGSELLSLGARRGLVLERLLAPLQAFQVLLHLL